MNEANAAEILRGFSEHRAVMIARNAGHRWHWTAGTLLFPDAICPFCGGCMRSNRIWLLDERARKLRGQVAIVEGKLVKEIPEHPHADCTGYVCMNRASDVASALFLGMSMAHSLWQNTYRSDWKPRWKAWEAKVFDHTCTEEGRKGEMVAKLAMELADALADDAADELPTVTLAA